MNQRQQNSTSYPITFFMADANDHITGKTGLSPTVTISKNGGAFASAQGTVSEIGYGWYQLAGNATDRNTLGELLIHATATGADPFDGRYVIVPWDPFDGAGLGLSRIDVAVSTRAAPGAQMALQDNAITAAKIADGAITVAKAPNLDAAVSTRAPESGGNIAAIKAKTDQLNFTVTNRVDANVTHVAGTSQTARDLGAQLDATVSSRAPASTALSNAVWTDAKAGYLDVAISSRPSGADYTSARASKLDNLDATVSSRAAPGAQMALQDGAITQAKIADGAITSAKAPNLDVAVSTRAPASTALSNAVWTDQKAGYLDVAISSRASGADYTSARATKLDNLDATVSSRSTLTASDVWNHAQRTLTSFGSLISDIFSYAVEGSLTFVQAIRVKLSALAGKSAGGGTSNLTFRDLADTKNRISATVDNNGNRTEITLDGS